MLMIIAVIFTACQKSEDNIVAPKEKSVESSDNSLKSGAPNTIIIDKVGNLCNLHVRIETEYPCEPYMHFESKFKSDYNYGQNVTLVVGKHVRIDGSWRWVPSNQYFTGGVIPAGTKITGAVICDPLNSQTIYYAIGIFKVQGGQHAWVTEEKFGFAIPTIPCNN